jgi:hypothetical protein
MAASSSTTKTLVFWFGNIWDPRRKACKCPSGLVTEDGDGRNVRLNFPGVPHLQPEDANQVLHSYDGRSTNLVRLSTAEPNFSSEIP